MSQNGSSLWLQGDPLGPDERRLPLDAPRRSMTGVTEVSLLSEKLRRYGVLGAGVIRDSLTTLQLAEVATAAAPAEPKEERVVVTAVPGEPLSRKQILEVLHETVRVQGVVQQEVSALARKLAKERGDKKKRRPLSFADAHKKIQELGLPREPLEDLGLSESALQRLLMEHEQDEEVMACAQRLLHPVGKADPERAKGITMERVVDIHQFMVLEMQKVLQEFLQLPQEARRSFSAKGVETTAELLVSIAVEQQLSVRCEDVEQAVIRYEELLQGHPEFARCTEQLANMMQHLIGAAQPRVEKAEFVQILRLMGDNMREAKAFAKKLYEDYRAKSCDIAGAYQRFAAFSEAAQAQADGEELPDLSSVEMQLCRDEYAEDPEVRQLWEQSGAESSLAMQTAIAGVAGVAGVARAPAPAAEEKRGRKLKSSEVVEMQELMVDELKRTTELAAAVVKKGATPAWRADVAMQMVQALASAAVERRYGTSAEEMTIAGFQHAAVLQKNERFVRATEKQQEILMTIAGLCSQES
uniref:Uncharacterized protein n=1 Tax=Alexandrium catenella TaxID=2925 RepID=A0A7S1M369_ALECA